MSKISAKYFHDLWQTHTKQNAEEVRKKMVFTTHFFSGKQNNIGPSNISENVESAITECLTNAHDAVIMDHVNTNFFDSVDDLKVNDALEKINAVSTHPLVTVLVQNRTGRTDCSTISFFDEGSGIPDDVIEKTILAYSSESKNDKPYLHGTYGQGGANSINFGHGTLICTRDRKSDKYYWSYVWKTKITLHNGTEIMSIIYVKDANNKLFSFTEKEMLSFAAIVRPKDIDASRDDIILPEHGTVRRVMGMEVECSPESTISIFRAIPDKMFGSKSLTKIITENNLSTVTGRRVELNSIVVGKPICNEGPVLLGEIPFKKVMIVGHEQNFMVGVRTWFVDNYKKKNKDTSGIRFLRNVARNAASSVFVTSNGQTHGMLLNRSFLSDAGYNSLAENVIVEISVDDIPLEEFSHMMVSNRENIKAKSASALAKALTSYASAHEQFAQFNESFSMRGSSPENIARDLCEIIKTNMIGTIAGIQSFGKVSDGNKSSPASLAPFVPNDPPTFLTVHNVEIKPGEASWVTIKTDAPDDYAPSINITMPGFVEPVTTLPKLSEGTIRFQIKCDANAMVGLSGALGVSMRNMSDTATVKVVSVKKSKKGNAVPNLNYIRVKGKNDPIYIRAFPGIDDDTVGSFNFTYDNHEKMLTIYENMYTPELVKVREIIEKNFKGFGHVLDRMLQVSLVSAAMMVNKVEGFKDVGGIDAASHQLLSAIGVSCIGSAEVNFKNLMTAG